MVLNSDKGRITVVMNRENYERKMNEILKSDFFTYFKKRSNPLDPKLIY